MTLSRDLLRAEWAARRRGYASLFLLFAATSACFLLTLGFLSGLETRIGGELSENLAGDVRVTREASALADGQPLPAERDMEALIRRADPDARVAHRLEAEGLFLRGAGFTTNRPDAPGVSRSAGILVGVDAASEGGAFGPDRFLEAGVALKDAPFDLVDPTGARLVPIVVGDAFLRTTEASVAGPEFSWDSVINVTAGKTENGRLVGVRCVIVGTYETGFQMIDRIVVYMPRGEVARLLGEHPEDPPSNAALVRTSDPEGVAAVVASAGLDAMGANGFRESYFGPVFRVVRVVAWAILLALTVTMAAWFAHTLSHHVREDRRKISTLRAIGIPSRTLRGTYAVVAGGLSVGGALVGALLALVLFPLVALTSRLALPDPPLVPAVGVVETGALIVLLGVAASAAAQLALWRAFAVTVQAGLRDD